MTYHRHCHRIIERQRHSRMYRCFFVHRSHTIRVIIACSSIISTGLVIAQVISYALTVKHAPITGPSDGKRSSVSSRILSSWLSVPNAYRRLTLQDYYLDAIFGLADGGSSWAWKGKNVEGRQNIYTDTWVPMLSVVDSLRTWRVGRTLFYLLAFHQGG